MHIPVLLQEVIHGLNPGPSQHFIDATIDGGGHAEAILAKTEPDGELLGIDRDKEQLRRCGARLERYRKERRLFLSHGDFSHIMEISRRYDFGPIAGILFDLGLSAYHLEESGRGFSFRRNEPLDMRFDASDAARGGMHPPLFGREYRRGSEEGGLHLGSFYLTAGELVNQAEKEELTRILRLYGEERFAVRIARAIITTRAHRPIKTTGELRDIILRTIPKGKSTSGRIHPATRTFQALRIAVNRELNAVTAAIPRAFSLLAPGGRLAVISYHSLEDRIVKHCLRYFAKANLGNMVAKKPIRPTLRERRENPRSRSARLRIIQRARDAG